MSDTPFHRVDTVFIKVTDLAAAARGRGVETGPVERAPDQPVTRFWFRDPDGNRLEVCSY